MNRRQFLITEYLLTNPQGLTRAEIGEKLTLDGVKPTNKRNFLKDTSTIREVTGLDIIATDYGKNIWRYSVRKETKHEKNRIQVIGTIVANFLENQFLSEFKDLGNKIQSLVIPEGNQYLVTIGKALRNNLKLHVTYHKFNSQPYQATLHPYCLKVFENRWYLLAYKENTEHEDAKIQCFSLDRIKDMQLTTESFTPDSSINIATYFRDAYGIWVDPEHYPVQDVEIACTAKVANYLRTLPLHHSQKEIECDDDQCHFTFHISPTPDFIGELKKWGEDITMVKDIKTNNLLIQI